MFYIVFFLLNLYIDGLSVLDFLKMKILDSYWIDLIADEFV